MNAHRNRFLARWEARNEVYVWNDLDVQELQLNDQDELDELDECSQLNDQYELDELDEC